MVAWLDAHFPIGKCSICGKIKWRTFITPADPPFFGKRKSRHCFECGLWLETGEFGLRRHSNGNL